MKNRVASYFAAREPAAAADVPSLHLRIRVVNGPLMVETGRSATGGMTSFITVEAGSTITIDRPCAESLARSGAAAILGPA